MHLIWNILLLSLAVFAVSRFLPGIYCKNFFTAAVVAIVYSIINFVLGWFLILISLPAIILTMGLFIFIINAVLLFVTDKMIEDFSIRDFGTTVLAAFFITIAHSVSRWVFF